MLEPERFYAPGTAGAEASTAERMQRIQQIKTRLHKERDAAGSCCSFGKKHAR